MGQRARDFSVQKRRVSVARLYTQGWNIRDIARRLSKGKSTIARDLKAIEAEWKAAQHESIDDYRRIELAKIMSEEREVWTAWNRSKKASRLKIGDPRFLQALDRLRDKRCKLLGLYEQLEGGERVERWVMMLPGVGAETTEDWEQNFLSNPDGAATEGVVH